MHEARSTGGYLNRRQRHPGFLIAAIAINLSAVGAMLASGTLVVIDGDNAIPTIKIAPPIVIQPPKPTKIEPQKREQRTERQVDVPVPPLPLPRFDETVTWREAPLPPLPPLPPIGDYGSGGSGQTAKPVEVAAAFDPRFAAQVQPPYPAWLERAEIEGKVSVRLQVGTDGRVTAVELLSTSHPDFFPVTREQALRKWRFKPATRDGVPVVSWVTKTVRFEVRRS